MPWFALLLLAQHTAFVPLLGLHDKGVFNRFAPYVTLVGAEGYAARRVGLMLNLHKDVLHLTVDRVPVSVIPTELAGSERARRWLHRWAAGAVFRVASIDGPAGRRVVRLQLLSSEEAQQAVRSQRLSKSRASAHRRVRARVAAHWRRRPPGRRLTLVSHELARCESAICLRIPSLTLDALARKLSTNTLLVLRRLKWPSDRDQDGIHDQVDLLIGAKKLIWNKARYVEAFHYIEFPMGDVPTGTGVCTDVLVRSMRNAGIDLQVLLQRHIARFRKKYPWIESRSPNIDHRRVRNLLILFKDRATLISTGINESNKHLYLPGDIVFMDTKPKKWGPDHVGIISDRRNSRGYPLVINNRARGPQKHTAEMDLLPQIPITHHFRWR